MYDLSINEEKKLAVLTMDQLSIDFSTIMQKVLPIVEDYGMHYTENTVVSTPKYETVADITEQGTEQFYEARKENGIKFILFFTPNDHSMPKTAFRDIANLVGKQVSKKVNTLTKKQAMNY